MVSSIGSMRHHNVTKRVKTMSMEKENTVCFAKKHYLRLVNITKIIGSLLNWILVLCCSGVYWTIWVNDISVNAIATCFSLCNYSPQKDPSCCGLTVCRVCQSNVLETCLEMAVGLYAWHSRVEYFHLIIISAVILNVGFRSWANV